MSTETPPRPKRSARARTPSLLQMEAVECGAAALGMVLGSYGRWEPLEVLRVECGVTRDGSSAGNLVRAARRFGFDAKGMRLEVDQLETAPMPAILHWNFNHFVVLEGFDGRTAWINDPANGPREVPRDDLEASFTGIAVTLSPGAEFERGGAPFSATESLRGRLRTSVAPLVVALVSGLALVVPGLAAAALVQTLVDEVLVGGRSSWALPLLGGLVLVAVLQGALTWLQHRTLLRMEAKLAIAANSRFLWHLLRLPMAFFLQRYPGDLARRVSLNPQLAQLVTSQGALAGINAVAALLFVVVMVRYDVLLTVIAVAFAAVNVVVVRRVFRRNVINNQRLLADQGKLQGAAAGGLFNIETLKATGRESDFFSTWSGHHARLLNSQRDFALTSVVLAPLPTLVSSLTTAAILVIGGLRVLDGDLTIGALLGFQTLLVSFSTPVQAFVASSGQLQQAEGFLRRLDDILEHPVDPVFERPGERGELRGTVELRDVTFGYNPLAAPIIEGFSLRLQPGARVALVGGSGSGKSTVSKLLCGLYEPWEGEVLFDGRPRRDFDRQTLADGLALVDQDILLFEGTLRDNLTLWDPTIPDERLVAAARDAEIHGDIARRQGGYDAQVDEDGRNFSGGQRQRLEIARALIGEPRILVLDEATSALDPITEQRIDENLRRRGSTLIIVAHRLSTVRDADEIIVLERGAVVERGTHDELMRLDGAYASLAALGEDEARAT